MESTSRGQKVIMKKTVCVVISKSKVNQMCSVRISGVQVETDRN